MAGEENDVVIDTMEQAQALGHRRRIGSWQVGSSAAVEEQRVAGDEAAVDKETLAPWSMAGGVHEPDLDIADGHDITGGVGDQMVGAHPRCALHPLDLVGLNMDGARDPLEQGGDPLDVVSHDRPANVVSVVVGGEHADDGHAVIADPLDEVAHVPRGIDEQALPG